jgi:hypothetical protein
VEFLELYLQCLAGNELFYAMLYLLNFTTGPFYLFVPLAVITFPVAVAKTGIALLQVKREPDVFFFFGILTVVDEI